MKNLYRLNCYRITSQDVVKRYGSTGDHCNGVFRVPSDTDDALFLGVIASRGDGWEHISVSTAGRCPTWAEMEQIKRLFFNDNEVAMQLHVPPVDHINKHPYCLHLWRPIENDAIPLPPKYMIG